LGSVCGLGTSIPAPGGVLCGLIELKSVVGRGGLEPPTSALARPEQCAPNSAPPTGVAGCYVA
jgi:hypothetical protein